MPTITTWAQPAPDSISAGPLGLLVVLLMGIATVLLIRNMNGRLKRLPQTFAGQQSDGPADAATTETAGSAEPSDHDGSPEPLSARSPDPTPPLPAGDQETSSTVTAAARTPTAGP